MNKHKSKLNIFALLFFVLSNLQAQKTTSSTGGGASRTGGLASYTIGQVLYSFNEGTNGNSFVQGVQQPYEISVIASLPEAEDLNLFISAYPNPTTYFLTVKIALSTTLNVQSLQYIIFDINGKRLQTTKATGHETKIKTNKLANGIYFLKVLNNTKIIRVFKIVKN